MNPAGFEIRRATVDDLGELRALWQAAHLPAAELERRLTEFQVACSNGTIRGAMGFHIENHQGLIHDEAYTAPDLGDSLRPQFWERIQTIARNHGLFRIWTLATTHFFRTQGMQEPDPETLRKLPASFGHPNAGWLTLKLREELPQAVTLDSEFALFEQSQKDETARLMRRAQWLKGVAYGLAAALVVVVFVAWVVSIFKLNRARFRKK